MRKPGGIVALIGGLLGFIAAIFTLVIGSIGSNFNADAGDTIISLGWSGILICSLIIVLGAVAINAKTSMPGILIIILSIFGAIYGGTPVAILMIIALIGGVLACMNDGNSAPIEMQPQDAKSNLHSLIKTVSLAVLIFVGILWVSKSSQQTTETPTNIAIHDEAKSTIETLTVDTSIQPNGELAEIFSFGSDFTDLQRENKLNEIRGKIIAWQLPVYDVIRSGDGYIIQTGSHLKNDFFGQSFVNTSVHVVARNTEEEILIASFKTGDIVSFKGKIIDSTMRNLEINPAILITTEESPSAEDVPPTESLQGHVNNMSLYKYLGKPPLEILGDEGINQICKKLLGTHHDKFLYNLALGSEAGLEMDSNFLLGFGCNKDSCETEQAAFAIDKQTNEMFAVLATSEGVSFFGVDSAEKLPANLRSWYEQLPNKTTPVI